MKNTKKELTNIYNGFNEIKKYMDKPKETKSMKSPFFNRYGHSWKRRIKKRENNCKYWLVLLMIG